MRPVEGVLWQIIRHDDGSYSAGVGVPATFYELPKPSALYEGVWALLGTRVQLTVNDNRIVGMRLPAPI